MTHGEAKIPDERTFPRYLLGVLQNESEMLQAPGYDVSALLEVDPWFDVELFTDRTAGDLLANQDQFDCIVVGYNAAHKSPVVQHELESQGVRVGLCVLHQYSAAGHSFFPHELELTFEKLEGPDAGFCAASQLEPDDEVLLAWPERLRRTADGAFLTDATAHYGVVPSAGSSWCVVLDATVNNRRVPVLLRTRTARRPRAVMCSIVTAARDNPSHADLLRNLLLWCAAGRPSAVLIDSPAAPDVRTTHRKMHLQGANAIAYSAEARGVDFTRWPIRGTRDVVLPPSLDPTIAPGWPKRDTSGAHNWLRSGGRIAVLGPDASLTIRHGEMDVSWIVRRWAAWFHSTPERSWHGGPQAEGSEPGSLVATRSVLRVLAAVAGGDYATVPTPGAYAASLALQASGISASELGLRPCREYADPARALLRSRLGDDDNVDRTVTATTAALDIDALVGRVLDNSQRKAVETWLERVSPGSAIDDRLEIARCLQSKDILRTAIAKLTVEHQRATPVSAVRVSALRAAVVACELSVVDRLSRDASGAIPGGGDTRDTSLIVVDRELRASGLLAAMYLLSVCDLQAFWSKDPVGAGDALTAPPDAIVDRAVITLGRLGPLIRGTAGASSLAELVCTEALALIAYFGRAPSPTHVLAGVEATPPQLLSSVLVESEGLRRENAEFQRLSRRERRATGVVGVIGVLVVAALCYVAVVLLQGNSSGVEVIAEASAVAIGGSVGMVALLVRADVEPRWAMRLAQRVPANRDEFVQVLKDFVSRRQGS